MSDLTTGMLWSSTLPSWQRDYYQLLLLETLRTKSILVPYCIVKEDFAAANSGSIVYTEVYDTSPNFNAITESDIWQRGAYLDSRTVKIQLEIHGDVLKFSDYNEVVQYVNSGNMRGLVREKIGQNQVDYLDIMARNAFMGHPNRLAQLDGVLTPNGSLVNIDSDDYFNPDFTEVIRTHLEENDIPGVANPGDGDSQVIVCTTSPRVIKDIRVGSGSKWLEVNEYAGGQRKFTSEVGMWGGVRFVKSNRLRLRNHGVITTQTTLNGATVVGQGAAQTVDSVYTVGQSNSTRYVTVTDETGFSVGQYVTIHDVTKNGGAGNPPIWSDGTQETRRIVSIDAGQNRLVFDKPLLQPHASGDLVTNGLNLHTSIFHGGPGVVYAVGERPSVIMPPKYDDLMIINRLGWRGFLKFQVFRPEFFEVIVSAGSTD